MCVCVLNKVKVFKNSNTLIIMAGCKHGKFSTSYYKERERAIMANGCHKELSQSEFKATWRGWDRRTVPSTVKLKLQGT